MSKYNLQDLLEGMSDKEFADAQEKDRLEKHPEKDKIKAIQALLAKEQLYYQVNRMIDQLTDRDIHGVMLMLEGLRKEIQDGIYD